MCSHLFTTAQAAPTIYLAHLFSELKDLLQDEEIPVRITAFKNITNLITILPQDTLTQEAIPLLKRYLNPVDMPEQLQHAVADLYGPMLFSLSRALTQADAT